MLIVKTLSKKLARRATDDVLAHECAGWSAVLCDALDEAGIEIPDIGAEEDALLDLYPHPVPKARALWAESRTKAGKPVSDTDYAEYTARVAERQRDATVARSLRGELARFLAIAHVASEYDLVGALRAKARAERKPLDRERLQSVEAALSAAASLQ